MISHGSRSRSPAWLPADCRAWLANEEPHGPTEEPTGVSAYEMTKHERLPGDHVP